MFHICENAFLAFARYEKVIDSSLGPSTRHDVGAFFAMHSFDSHTKVVYSKGWLSDGRLYIKSMVLQSEVRSRGESRPLYYIG